MQPPTERPAVGKAATVQSDDLSEGRASEFYVMSVDGNAILAVGASARSAAHSARRAGFHPLAIDLFADDDLVNLCQAERWDYRLDTLLGISRRLPPCPWFYTGGLENHPDVIEALAGERLLYGNRACSLSAVRDPWLLASGLARHGFQTPRLLAVDEDLPSGSWLLKRRRSAGGFHIQQIANPQADDEVRPVPLSLKESDRTSYLQQYIAGPSYAAIYLGTEERTELVGVTQQLVGRSWTGACRFGYSGSIGPLDPDECRPGELRRLGTVVAREFSLRGLFGIDMVCNREGIWVIEVNPRYTASIEVLEWACGVPTIAHHVAACQGRAIPALDVASCERCFGKAVIFSRRSVEIKESFQQLVHAVRDRDEWPAFADLPPLGSVIPKGRPITTVFACGATRWDVEARLRQRGRKVYQVVEGGDGCGMVP